MRRAETRAKRRRERLLGQKHEKTSCRDAGRDNDLRHFNGGAALQGGNCRFSVFPRSRSGTCGLPGPRPDLRKPHPGVLLCAVRPGRSGHLVFVRRKRQQPSPLRDRHLESRRRVPGVGEGTVTGQRHEILPRLQRQHPRRQHARLDLEGRLLWCLAYARGRGHLHQFNRLRGNLQRRPHGKYRQLGGLRRRCRRRRAHHRDGRCKRVPFRRQLQRYRLR